MLWPPVCPGGSDAPRCLEGTSVSTHCLWREWQGRWRPPPGWDCGSSIAGAPATVVRPLPVTRPCCRDCRAHANPISGSCSDSLWCFEVRHQPVFLRNHTPTLGHRSCVPAPRRVTGVLLLSLPLPGVGVEERDVEESRRRGSWTCRVAPQWDAQTLTSIFLLYDGALKGVYPQPLVSHLIC